MDFTGDPAEAVVTIGDVGEGDDDEGDEEGVFVSEGSGGNGLLFD